MIRDKIKQWWASLKKKKFPKFKAVNRLCIMIVMVTLPLIIHFLYLWLLDGIVEKFYHMFISANDSAIQKVTYTHLLEDDIIAAHFFDSQDRPCGGYHIFHCEGSFDRRLGLDNTVLYQPITSETLLDPLEDSEVFHLFPNEILHIDIDFRTGQSGSLKLTIKDDALQIWHTPNIKLLPLKQR
jgi:hypothetical protein